MGSVLRYFLLGLLLTAVWLLAALSAIPGGLTEVEEFSLYGWPALGLLFLVPVAVIWIGLWVVRLQRRVHRLQELIFDYGAGGPAAAPSYPLERARQRAMARDGGGLAEESPLAEAWQEDPTPEPAPRAAPKRVAFSQLDTVQPEPRAAAGGGWPGAEAPPPDGRRTAPLHRAAAQPASAAPVEPWDSAPPTPRRAGAAAAEPPAPSGPHPAAANGRGNEVANEMANGGGHGPGGARPRRAAMPEPEPDIPDTSPEPLGDELELHRPPRAHPNAPRLEALTPTYRSPSEMQMKALSPEQYAQHEARTARELNAVAMDLASVLSAPTDYDRALAALNGGREEAFFLQLIQDFRIADRASLDQQLAMVGGDSMLDTYLEKYEQLLVVAYRSDPGGTSVKRLVDSPMGRLHQAIESYRAGRG